MKCVGDTEIYKPEDDGIIETMIEHNNILKEEEDGEIDINKIEGEVSDKQREKISIIWKEREQTYQQIFKELILFIKQMIRLVKNKNMRIKWQR